MPEVRPERQRRHRTLTGLAALAACVAPAFPARAAEPLTAEQVEFFEARIRPVLAQDCYECHRSGGKTKAGLALDHRAGLLEGGHSGPAIVPGDPANSLLMTAIRHEDEDLEMPKAGAKLEDRIVADFEQWIAMGAPDPRDEPANEAEIALDTDWAAVMERRKAWWSFQPIAKPNVPDGRADHPVDRFIERKLAEGGLEPTERADRRTLIRRLSFALRGLPPTPEESAAFASDDNPGAYERLVDRYLDSPQFGERWARHWMDWLRYAESSGSEGDPMIPQAWRYRDYLIRALNADVPYDQLVREHVAGDLLDEPRVSEGRNESTIGPAHLRMVFHGFAPTDALDELVRFTDDQIAVLTKGFMGLTVSCARCHDHKFDAISQADYYALFGVFASTKPGMVTADHRDAEDEERRARIGELKDQIRNALADHWLSLPESITGRLATLAEALARADDPKHVLYPFRAFATSEENGEALRKVLREWRARRDELAAHRGRTYRHEWKPSDGDGGGTLRGPSAGRRQRPGSFAVAAEAVVEAIHPAGVYSHLTSRKDAGVALSPRLRLDGEYDLWARVAGDGEAMIRYVVQNYPRDGTVFPVAVLKGGAWRWQKWDLAYWKGDRIHLEVTTAPEQAALAKDNERSWFGIREAVVVEKGEPGPPEDPLEFVEPLLEAIEQAQPADAEALAKAYEHATRESAAAWRTGEATDGQAMLLQELLAAGILPNEAGRIAGMPELLDEYRKLEAEIAAPARVPGVWEADSFDQPLFVRGDHKQPADPVRRRFLEAIDATPYETDESGRRELAEDLLRRDNPFTARVIVNRLWHHLFGRGLVATADNFGRLGEKPTHPELLDFLATRFVDDGWSIRKTIKLLVMSEAWQRSSTPSGEAAKGDPDNKLLSHSRVQRLEAEAIRDSLLAVAGELDEAMFGPPITGEAPRRSVYMRVKRNDLDPFLAAFDAPTPASTVGRRDVTNVPAQSLTILNSDFVIGLAERWAERASGESAEAKAAAMFGRALGREPSEDELQRAVEFVKSMAERRRGADEERRTLEAQLREIETKLAELTDAGRERVLAVRGEAENAAEPAAAAPVAWWDFEDGAKDRIGDMHVTLHGGARIENGALAVGGEGGFASTAPLAKSLRAMTLEAWVQLDDLDQQGGGVMTVQTLDGNEFNSVVFAEQEPRRWLAGSEHHRRTGSFNGPDENEAANRPVHLAIVWHENGIIAGYRDGVAYGKAYQSEGPKEFAAGNAQVLFGCRHGAPSGNRLLSGRIFEARLHDRALSAEEIAVSAKQAGNYIADNEILAALSEAERAEREILLERREELRGRLSTTDRPGRPGNEWADLAHALFNLKEFIYLR